LAALAQQQQQQQQQQQEEEGSDSRDGDARDGDARDGNASDGDAEDGNASEDSGFYIEDFSPGLGAIVNDGIGHVNRDPRAPVILSQTHGDTPHHVV